MLAYTALGFYVIAAIVFGLTYKYQDKMRDGSVILCVIWSLLLCALATLLSLSYLACWLLNIN